MIKLIKTLFGLIQNMTTENKRFIPTQEEAARGVQPMVKSEIIEALARYKVQNPEKYEAKKKALFKKYGIEIEPVQEIDEEIVKLETAAKKTKKLNIV